MQMKQTQTTEAETVIAPEIEPAVKARLDALVSTCRTMVVEATLQKEAIEVEKAKILKLLQDNGIEKVDVAGEPVQIVRSTSSSLDKVKFVQLGGSLKQLEDATIKKPKKPYVLIGEEAA